MGLPVGPRMPSNPSSVLKTPAPDLSRTQEALRSLLGGELEMRFGGNPIEGSNPSLSATIFPHRLSLVEWRYELCGT